ncbi:hypothetical protein N0V90_012776 [Kalmusia sp. IMI 367209]|nr:hypothetical protein N0V90_012776 [Kalmusia sp. IMI 367209]
MRLLLVTIASLGPGIVASTSSVEAVHVREVIKRQDPSSIDLDSIFASQTLIPSACLTIPDLPPAPTVPPALVSAMSKGADPCSLTGDAQQQLSSYESQFSDWIKTAEQSYRDALSDCPIASLAPTGLDPMDGATGKGSGNVAPKATMAAAVGVWAGVAGIVAAL